MATRIRLDYGAVEVLRYESGEGAGYIRRERYIPDDGRPAVLEYSHAASRSDVSPRHRIYPDYDHRCGWCWLNATHTQDAHAREIPPARESLQAGESPA